METKNKLPVNYWELNQRKPSTGQFSKAVTAHVKGKIVARSVRSKVTELTNDDNNILSYQNMSPTRYSGNKYKTYKTAVVAIDKKYRGVADWGTSYSGGIIDTRAAFTVPAGLEIVPVIKGDVVPEMEFATELLRFNGLDDAMALEFAKESEIEAKLCVLPFYDEAHEWGEGEKKKTGMIKVRFFSWTSNRYTVVTEPDDYLDFKELVYREDGKKKDTVIKKPNFTYRRFGGRTDQPNEPAMKIWKCLTQIDFLDMAVRDWREINRLYASPTPSFKCTTKDDVTELLALINKMNWKIKKLIVSTAEFKLVGPDMAGIDSIEREIIALAKTISGATGVPVHFLGLPDLLSNRATADNLMQLTWASTVKEREIWNSAYTEMLRKAIDMYNLAIKTGETGEKMLRNDVLRIEVTEVSDSVWAHLEKVFIPLLLAGKLSLDFVLSKIPGLNMDEEKELQEKMKEDELVKQKEEMDKIILENENNDLNNNNQGNSNQSNNQGGGNEQK